MIGMDDVNDVMSLVNPSMIGVRAVAAGIGGLGIMSALSLVIPSWVDRVMPPPRQDSLYDFLPFREVCQDLKTVRCDANRWLRVIELKGADITLADEDKRDRLYDARKRAVDELERHGIDHVKFYTVKERMELTRSLHPRQPLIRTVCDEWEETFPTAYRLRHYLMFVVKQKTYADACGDLDPAENYLVSTLGDYGARVMVEPRRADLDPESGGERASGPLRAIAHVISPLSRPDPLGAGWKGNLSALVTGDDVDFTRTDKGTVTFRHGDEKLHACLMTYKDCGEKTSESIMRDVLAIDCEMVIYHAIRPISTAVAIAELNRGRAASVGEHLSFNAKGEYDLALKAVEGQIAEERAALVYYSMHVMPLCRSEREIKAVQGRLTSVMTRMAGTVTRLRGSAQPTIMSMVSFDDMWPRKFRYLSTNVATNIYPQKSETGMMRSDWADEPLAFFRTVTGDPYPWQFHAHDAKGAPAHTLLIGPTGAGKTSLMTFLAANSMRVPNLRVFLMDRLNGMKIFTTCAGGRYIEFNGDDKNASLNPLHLPDSPDNQVFLRRWLKLITGVDDPASEEEIARAVKLVYSPGQTPSNRRLVALQPTAFDALSLVKKGLRPWTRPEVFGTYFNAMEDSLDLESTRLAAFNMTEVLNNERLAPAIMHYLMHRFRNLSITTTDPSLMIVDETAPMLRNPLFREFLQVGLQEGRKLRQAYVLCFQTAQALQDTQMSQIVLDQCGTMVFFRNLRDSEASIQSYRDFGLNESEIDFIIGRTFKDRRFAVLVKRPNSNDSAIVDVDLKRLGKYLSVFESDARQVALLGELMKTMPREQAVRTYIETRR